MARFNPRSLVFRIVCIILLTSIVGIAIIAAIIHQTTQATFDTQRVNWETLAQQAPSTVQAQLQDQFRKGNMAGACNYLEQLDKQRLTMDVVLTDNNQTVHCATKPRFKFAQVVFHESGIVRLFSNSEQVMAYDLVVSESLPLKNNENKTEGWAMTVKAKPLMLAGSEFAWRVWQESGIWLALTLMLMAFLATLSLRKLINPITHITNAASQLQQGDIPEPLNTEARTTEIAAMVETFNKATSALRDTETLRQQLVADIAHELRTPVTNIKGQLEALQMRLISDNDEFHHTVANEVLLLQQLISDFQDLSQTDSGQICLNLHPFPLLELVEDCLLTQKRNGVTFSIDISPELVIRTDELRFRQILLNLLENAKRAKPENLHVQVSAEAKPEGIELVFCDNGPGIDDTDAPHIFERFYRAEKSRNRTAGGSGLGLAIVKGLMLRMQGDIKLHPTEESGACFVLTLPAATCAKQHQTDQQDI